MMLESVFVLCVLCSVCDGDRAVALGRRVVKLIWNVEAMTISENVNIIDEEFKSSTKFTSVGGVVSGMKGIAIRALLSETSSIRFCEESVRAVSDILRNVVVLLTAKSVFCLIALRSTFDNCSSKVVLLSGRVEMLVREYLVEGNRLSRNSKPVIFKLAPSTTSSKVRDRIPVSKSNPNLSSLGLV